MTPLEVAVRVFGLFAALTLVVGVVVYAYDRLEPHLLRWLGEDDA